MKIEYIRSQVTFQVKTVNVLNEITSTSPHARTFTIVKIAM